MHEKEEPGNQKAVNLAETVQPKHAKACVLRRAVWDYGGQSRRNEIGNVKPITSSICSN